jgi:hypothetical protein
VAPVGRPHHHQHVRIRFAGAVASLTLAAACGPSGAGPALQPVSDQVVGVNQELVVVLAATDPDGDELSYSFSSDLPDGASGGPTITSLAVGAGEFRWVPLASDVGEWTFEFTVSDGSHKDSVTALIDVRSAVGARSSPRFLHPQGGGTTLDLDKNDCVDVPIEIVDSDSTEVEIGHMEPLVAESDLNQTDGLRGEWTWCPTEPQIEADDRYNALLTADDGDNPRTIHPYLIVLRRPTKLDCPGEAPVITHTAADLTTGAGLTMTAEISDDQGIKNEPLLYYSNTQPSEPPDLASMTQQTMRLDSGDMQSGTWSVRVPNPVAGEAAGATGSVYYLIAASDDDDPAGSCDHLTQSPATGSFAMVVTNPGGEAGGELCEPCTHDVQCGGTEDLCVSLGSSAEAFCLSACDGPSDCPSDYTCSAEPVESENGASARQCVPVSIDCSDPGGQICEDDGREDNDTPEQAVSRPALPAGSHDLVSCPASVGTGDDEDWFEIEVTADTTLEIELAGGDVSDLDLQLLDQDGGLLDSSMSLTSEELVTACVPAGSYMARVFAFGPQRNPYSLSVTRTPGSCAATCEVDENEDDDGPAQARATEIFPDPFVSTTQSICAGDDDWYEVEMFNGELLVVDLTFEQTSGQEDLDIHLHDDAGVDLTPCSLEELDLCDLENGQGADSDEHFEFQTPATGCAPCTFFVVVRGFDDSENLYDISIEAQP